MIVVKWYSVCLPAWFQFCKIEFPCHGPGSMATNVVVCDVVMQGEGLLGGFNILSEESHLMKVNGSFDFKTFKAK